MQRVRMSLPYFKQYGWEAEVVIVDPSYSDLQKDDLLIETVPADIKIHTVKALNKKWTSRIGFGNIAFRSYSFYKKKVNELLSEKKFDLIYFSTTQFAICTLGAYWKKRFGVPYVIDMQDPWHSEYYRDKPKAQQPPKYWLSYRINKYLEPLAMKKADGLISVSEQYIADLKKRYAQLENIPSATITFGGFEPDLAIALKNKDKFANLLDPVFKTIVYAGRGGIDMHKAITPLFKALKQGLTESPELFNKLKIYFIGTSYAPAGQEVPTISPLAKHLGISENIVEITSRISYFNTLATLQQADALFIPGSDDPRYTASKIYPYLLIKKPLLAIFNSESSALTILDKCGAEYVYSFNATPNLETEILNFLKELISGNIDDIKYNEGYLEEYAAKNITRKQCELFDKVLNKI
jgi:hypothetical protein